MDAVLGIDIGSSRIKATAFDATGAVVAHESVRTPVKVSDGLTDFPVVDIVEACRRLVAAVSSRDLTIQGVGIAAMGEVGTVLKDDTLVDLSFPAWHDSRGHDVIETLGRAHDPAALARLTGGHFRTVSSLAKLAWMRASHGLPDGIFVNVASAVAWSLTGIPTQDGSLAVTTGAVDPARSEFHSGLWAQAGLAGLSIAPIEPPQTHHPTTTEASHLWHLPGAIPVMVVGHDHPVAAVGTGASPGFVVDSLGTGEPVLAALTPDARSRHHQIMDALDLATHSVETWPSTGDPLVIAEGLRPGLAMESFLELSGLTRAEADASLPRDPDADLEDEDIAQLERGVLTFAPTTASWSSIHWYFTRRAATVNDALRLTTASDGPTVLTGGGTRSRAWVAMKASLASNPVLISTTMDTGTRGAAAMVGSTLGWWAASSDMPCAGLVPVDAWLSRTR